MRLTYLYQDREHGLPPRDNTPPFTFSDIRSMAYKSPRVPLLDRPGKENQPLLSWTSTALKRKLGELQLSDYQPPTNTCDH